MSAAVRFHRSLVTALPGQGFREWIYHEMPERHDCDEDGCECDGDDSAIVVGLRADSDGCVEEVTDSPHLVGILPEGQVCTPDEAAAIYSRKLKEGADRRAWTKIKAGAGRL